MQKTDLSIAPYFDDFEVDKQFYRILFRPGYAVQGRELTQLQSILQDQIEQFGRNVFQEGSIVTGGQTDVHLDVTYLKLESTFNGQVVNVNNLNGAEIVDLAGRGVRGRVIVVAAEGADPPTLMIRYVSGQTFQPGDTLCFSSASAVGVAKVRSDIDAVGLGSVATIQEGVFFIRGFFVHTPQQIIILDKYGTVPSYSVGLEISELIITERDDTSLLDPALDASNFQAPGAHRFSIQLLFNKRDPNSIDTNEFVKLIKVVNGQIIEWVRYPFYSEIEKTMARRTYDESGNYTVKSWRASVSEDPANNNNYIITLDPGKAYVFGFEFETVGPTILNVAKPRNKASITSYDLSMNYGNFVYVTNAAGFFDSSKFSPIDLHIVPTTSLDFTSANVALYANTKIGQARIREWVLDSVGNPSSASSYIYRAHMFEVNTYNVVANAAGGTINSITLPANFPTNANAFRGVIVSVVGGPATGDRRTIVTQTGNVANVDSNFSAVITSASQIQFAYQFKDVESIAIRNVAGVNAYADIGSASKANNTTFHDTVLTDPGFDSLFFELPYSYVVATDASNGIVGINNVTYQYRKVFTPTLTANTVTINLSGVEQFIGSTGVQSTLQKQQNWFIEVSSPAGGSIYTAGQVVPVGDPSVSITLSGGSQTANITVAGAYNSTISLIALVSVQSGGRKTKTIVTGNTTAVPTPGAGQQCYDDQGNAFAGANVYASLGQVTFSTVSALPKTSDTDLRLFIPDVFQLVKVVQSANANVAVATADLTNPAQDITNRYTLDTGMRDGFYGMARIRLISGQRPPTGQLLVIVNYYAHDTNQGYFSVDSYPNANNQTGYAAIPRYTSSTGRIYDLRDVIDFRPRKLIGFANTYVSPISIGAVESNFILDFAYYLARIDYLVLTRDRRFDVVEGIDSLTPAAPKPRDDAMLLNVLTMPPYVLNAANNINVRTIENKRYTMRDIGGLEQRINALEYYTTLTMLESAAMKKNDESIKDNMGLERTKNGIIVDSFADFSACDVTNNDWQASLDIIERRMKSSFNNQNFDMFFSANGSIAGTYKQSGYQLTLPWTDTPLVFQNLASLSVNINPFHVTRWQAALGIHPASDTWIDTQMNQVITNPSAGLPLQTTQVIYDSWTTLYNGHLTSAENNSGGGISLMYSKAVSAGVDPNIRWFGSGGQGFGTLQPWQGMQDGGTDFQVGYKSTRSRVIEWEEVQTVQGTRVISTTIIPIIRSRGVAFSCKNLRPNTAYYSFFDGKPVSTFIRRANVIRVANVSATFGSFTEETKDTYGSYDILQHYTNYPPATVTYQGADILLTYAANVGLTVPSKFVQGTADWVVNYGDPVIANTPLNSVFSVSNLGNDGQIAAGWRQIAIYEHYSGNVVSASATTLQISPSAHANAYFFSPTIGRVSYATLATFSPVQWASLGLDGWVNITNGTGANQARQITNYNLVTNTFTVTPAWSVTPSPSDGYSIGVPRTLETGHIGGIFHIPNTASMQFMTGDRIFKLTDSIVNDDNAATSVGVGKYSASGTLQVVKEDILVTRRLKSDTTQDSSSGIVVVIPSDPLAQSFFVDSVTYPMGVMLSKFRFCFSAKDNFLPVRCQIRQMVNGFPDALNHIAECSLNPQYVKTSSIPSLVDPTLYTDFQFTTPVYLAPNKEYALVLLSDSDQYQVYVAQIGQSDINSGAFISSEPTLGSLFKSQNGSTWTPVQEQDMMFGAYICVFDTSKTANVNFRIMPALGANSNVDVFYFSVLTTSPPATEIDYQYASELAAGGYTPYKPFVPNQTTYFGDQLGRRIFKQGSNASFVVAANMFSTNPYVSPTIDISTGLSVFGIEHKINNGELSNASIVLIDGGGGYLVSDNANIQLTITGGGGSGAVALVNAVSGGAVTDIIITNPGSGYYYTPNISAVFVGNTAMRTANANLQVVMVGETSALGGNAKTRYLVKKVQLADGFDSSDIRVYMTLYKPPNSSVYVYYKVLSGEETTSFDTKKWNVMTQIGNSLVQSKNRNDLIEFTFAPGTNGQPSLEIIDNGYNTFKTFAIKVVFFSTNPIDIPEASDIRIIALPSGKTL